MASKAQSDALKAIKNLQCSALKDMKIFATSLISAAERTVKTIDEKGTLGYYSISNDVMGYAEKVWRNSLRLGELKRIEDDLNKNIKNERNARIASGKKTCK